VSSKGDGVVCRKIFIHVGRNRVVWCGEDVDGGKPVPIMYMVSSS
jgi:hypothetical protein